MAVQSSTVRAKVWLFHLKFSQGVRGSLSFNVTREICSYLQDSFLYQITRGFLRAFNCHTSTWGRQVPLQAHIRVSLDSVWVLLKDDRLFCSGGEETDYYYGPTGCRSYSLWNVAFLVSAEGEVGSLPCMHIERGRHGVIELQHVYVFGGSKY